jgi:hypothetical protein
LIQNHALGYMGKTLVRLLDNCIVQIYESEGLVSLSDNGYVHNGINIQANPKTPNPHPEWHTELNFNDILVCNRDLKYFTAQLFLHRPFINNPVVEVDDKTFDYPFATYHQNLWDRRYLMYVSCCFEKSYNFWDRIGDLLWSFHQNLIPKIRSVDFSKIIDELDKAGTTNADFIWLRDFKNAQYKSLNSLRIDVVHYHQYESKYRHEFLTHNTDFPALQALYDEKVGFAEYFKEQLSLQIEGCCRAYNFLNAIGTTTT